MAKKQTYTEEQLLDAVVQYSKAYKGKIQATKLTKWAIANIPGMEGLKDYMFQRPIVTRDPKTGKTVETKKECTKRIEEINEIRSMSGSIKSNVLLQSSKPGDFFALPRAVQEETILLTRQQVDQLLASNNYVTKENRILKKKLEEKEEIQKRLSDKLDFVCKQQVSVLKQVSAATAQMDEEMQREALAKMGVKDGGFDLLTYTKSLSETIDEAFSINNAIRKDKQSTDFSTDDMMAGMDF